MLSFQGQQSISICMLNFNKKRQVLIIESFSLVFGLSLFACKTAILGLLIFFSFTSHEAPIGTHAWSYKRQTFLALVGCLPICQVIY